MLSDSFDHLSTLAPGSTADIVIFDPDLEWVVDPNEFQSMGKNTPLQGATLKGQVIATMVQGRFVYEDDAVV